MKKFVSAFFIPKEVFIMDESKLDTINFRLEAIEKSIAGLTNLLVKVPIMDSEVKSLQKEQETQDKRITELKKNSDEKVKTLAAEISNLRDKITILENAPDKKKSELFTVIVDYIYKAIVAICVGYIFYKVGLN